MKIRDTKQYHTMARYTIAYLIMYIRAINSLSKFDTIPGGEQRQNKKNVCIDLLKAIFENRHNASMVDFHNDILRKKGL